MRILLISHNVVVGDGQGRVNLELARQCLSHNHQLTIIADRVEPGLVEQGATWIPLHPMIRRPNLVKTPLFAFHADRLVRSMRERFDLLVGNGYALTEQHDVNLCQFVHGARGNIARKHSSVLSPERWYQAAYTKFNALQEKKAYAAASVVVVASRSVQQELVGIGVPQDRIRVIYNGVDTDEFRPGPADQQALGLPTNGPLALFVGDIRSTRKNLGAVLRAMTLAAGVKLVVVGAVQGSPYPAMARKLGISDRVSFLGYRRDVATIMRACDFLVFPTRYEPFGLVVLEALSSGLPAVVTRAAGVAEIISPECGVILDDPDDFESLAQAMNRLGDGQAKAHSAAAARAIACEHSFRQMAERYLAVFEELVRRSAANHNSSSCRSARVKHLLVS